MTKKVSVNGKVRFRGAFAMAICSVDDVAIG
jgi:hypothetical protein